MADAKVMSISGGSMYMIGSLGIRTNPEDSFIPRSPAVFMFGATDARVHITKLARLGNLTEQKVSYDTVSQYLAAVKEFCLSQNLIPYISLIIPPPDLKPEMNVNFEWTIGTLPELVERTKYLNQLLCQECYRFQMRWFNPYAEFVDETGGIRMSDVEDVCHLAERHWPTVHKSFQEAAGIL